MSDETLSGQIVRLRDAFNAAAAGNYAHPSQEGLFENNSILSLEIKLYASNFFILTHLADDIDLSNAQIEQNLNFLKLTTFFGMAVCNNLSFWTEELNDDLEHSDFLFIRTNSGINAATQILSAGNTAEENPVLFDRICSGNEKFSALLHDFNLLHQRHASGHISYSEEERPRLPSASSAEPHFHDLRQEQTKNALEHVKILRDLALIYLKRMRFLARELLPSDPGNPEWQQVCMTGVNTSRQNGLTFLETAETILTYHAARHSAFPQRLAEAQRSLTAPHLH